MSTISEVPFAPACCATRSARYAWFAALAVVGCGADLGSKAAIWSWLGPPEPGNIYWLVDGYVGIETALNRGALFGMGQGMVWFFAAMSFLALAGITYWLIRRNAVDDWLLTVILGLVTGGVLGNLYDRLGLWSNFEIFAVRDWIRFSYGQLVWPNFNIADSLLVCGAALLVVHSFKSPPSR